MTESMHGKVVVVIGATSGIERASALDFARHGVPLHRVGVVLCRTLDDKLAWEEIDTTLRPFGVRLVHRADAAPQRGYLCF